LALEVDIVVDKPEVELDLGDVVCVVLELDLEVLHAWRGIGGNLGQVGHNRLHGQIPARFHPLGLVAGLITK
jgi:hypothetical protein